MDAIITIILFLSGAVSFFLYDTISYSLYGGKNFNPKG
jgi:hypothetical protein